MHGNGLVNAVTTKKLSWAKNLPKASSVKSPVKIPPDPITKGKNVWVDYPGTVR